MAQHKDFDTKVILRGAQSDGEVAIIENTVPAKWRDRRFTTTTSTRRSTSSTAS